MKYCRSGNICEVLIFANFARKMNSRIQESRESYYYNRATKKNENSRILNFVKNLKNENSRKFKHAKITKSAVYDSNWLNEHYNIIHSRWKKVLRAELVGVYD